MDARTSKSGDGNGRAHHAATGWDPDRVPVDELAAEFADRHRQGESPTIAEYVDRYPELAEEIRELFPVVLTMERMQHRIQQDSRVVHSKAPFSIEQLGDFRVIGEIARGGMGIVCEAEQVTLGRRVAVKVLPEHALRSPKDIQRFNREAQTAAKLHHSNIVPVFGVGEQDGVHYIVMQLIQGIGLDEILPEIKRIALNELGEPDGSSSPSTARSICAKRNAETLLLSQSLASEAAHPSSSSTTQLTAQEAAGRDAPSNPVNASEGNAADRRAARPQRVRVNPEYWRNVARIGLQAARALDYAHSQGTLHRDVKPGNLILDEDGVVWMADFGLAKAVEHDAVTWTGDIVGTLRYMAPERFRGETDSRSDIYSLGLTMYELLTFKRAFDGTDRIALTHNVTKEDLVPPRRHNALIPQDIETIVLKAAARDLSDRYATAAELAEDLECFLEDRPIRARRAGPVEQFVRWCRRNKAVASLAATVGIVLLAASFSTTLGYVRESKQRQLAEREGQRAQASSQLAIGALDKIYDQFAPRPVQPLTEMSEDGEDSMLAIQSPLPLSKDVALLLESLLDFYDELSSQAEGDESVLLKSVMANRRVGDIKYRLGEKREAEVSYKRAIGQVAAMGGAFEERESVRVELARIHNSLGIVQESQQEAVAAVASHRRALDLLDPVSVNPEARYELARTSYLLYLAEPTPQRPDGDTQDVERNNYLHQAISLLEDLTQRHPTIPDYRFLLARCHRVGGNEQRPEWRERAIKILDELVDEFPDVPDYRYELGDAYAKLDFDRLWADRDWYWNRDEVDRSPQGLMQAEARLLKAFEATGDIDVSHPNIPSYLRLKARLLHTYATVLRDMGKQEAALEQFRQASEKQRLVVRHDRDGHFQEVLKAQLELDMARTQSVAGKRLAARTTIRGAVTELSALLDDPACELNRLSRRFARELLAESRTLLLALGND